MPHGAQPRHPLLCRDRPERPRGPAVVLCAGSVPRRSAWASPPSRGPGSAPLTARCGSERRRGRRPASEICGSSDRIGNCRWRLPCIQENAILRVGRLEHGRPNDGRALQVATSRDATLAWPHVLLTSQRALAALLPELRWRRSGERRDLFYGVAEVVEGFEHVLKRRVADEGNFGVAVLGVNVAEVTQRRQDRSSSSMSSAAAGAQHSEPVRDGRSIRAGRSSRSRRPVWPLPRRASPGSVNGMLRAGCCT
jgi:hypothetical protein